MPCSQPISMSNAIAKIACIEARGQGAWRRSKGSRRHRVHYANEAGSARNRYPCAMSHPTWTAASTSGFDALGDGERARRGRQVADRAHHRPVHPWFAVRHPTDQRTVDLEHVDRQIPQIPQRGEAGPQVVDADPAPEPAGSRWSCRRRCPWVTTVLGDLEPQPRRVQAVFTEQPPEVTELVPQLPG